jgi:hypothetical protein
MRPCAAQTSPNLHLTDDYQGRAYAALRATCLNSRRLHPALGRLDLCAAPSAYWYESSR